MELTDFDFLNLRLTEPNANRSHGFIQHLIDITIDQYLLGLLHLYSARSHRLLLPVFSSLESKRGFLATEFLNFVKENRLRYQKWVLKR